MTREDLEFMDRAALAALPALIEFEPKEKYHVIAAKAYLHGVAMLKFRHEAHKSQ